ncbi:MAG: DNA repair protein RadC [Anaerolineales bacterium]|nr:DNA repair protein RadC [Anaerolineales bacterium]
MQSPLTLLPQYKPTRLKTLPLREQPAYRVSTNVAACSLAELLAAVIGGSKQIETAEGLLSFCNGDLQRLYCAEVSELASLHGVGQQTAVRLKAAFSLGLKLNGSSGERIAINSPADAANLVQNEMSLLEQEYLRVILLSQRNTVLDIVEVYHGSVNAAQIRIAEIFKPAIRRIAPALIVVHNHPSGDPTPSPDDVAVTRAMVQAGKLLDIQVLDHLVIGKGRFVSLKERGLGFS